MGTASAPCELDDGKVHLARILLERNRFQTAELAKTDGQKDALEAANLAKAQALEASGKKVAGGMHKFDASEVDVNGGDATADDLMEAFGF